MTIRNGEVVEVAKAKGRPMLSWVGKRPLREVQAFPSQLVERFAPEDAGWNRRRRCGLGGVAGAVAPIRQAKGTWAR